MSDLTALLLAVQDRGNANHVNAERALREAEESNLPAFIDALITELADENKPPNARMLAGILLKNSITAKSTDVRKKLEERWLLHASDVRNGVKTRVLETLSSPSVDVRRTCSLVIAAIGQIEIDKQEWPDCLPTLIKLIAEGAPHAKEAALETISYIITDLESIDSLSNEILTRVVACLRSPDSTPGIKLHAARALKSALEYTEENMKSQTEREYIMSVVCEVASPPNTAETRVVGLECLVEIARLYYKYLDRKFMDAIADITFSSAKDTDEDVAHQGFEFWTTIGDVEYELLQLECQGALEEEDKCKGLCRIAMIPLVEVTCAALLKKTSEFADDEYDVPNHASQCLQNVARVTCNDVVPPILAFVQANITASTWVNRDAALWSLGNIMEGPSTETLADPITSALPLLVENSKDPVQSLRETALWTLGQITFYHPTAVLPAQTQGFLMTGAKALSDPSPHVAAKGAFILGGVGQFMSTLVSDAAANGVPLPSSPLSPFFQEVVTTLLQATERQDASSGNLRVCSYEALGRILSSATPDVAPLLKELLPHLLTKIDSCLASLVHPGQDHQTAGITAGMLCAMVDACVKAMGPAIAELSDAIMPRLCAMMRASQSDSNFCEQEALFAIGSIASHIDTTFAKYIPDCVPLLVVTLANHEAYQQCEEAVGTVSDIITACGVNTPVQYLNDIIAQLLSNLREDKLSRNVKPTIIECIGDIAVAIETQFEAYLVPVVTMLEAAGSLTIQAMHGSPDDEELLTWLGRLRTKIAVCYTMIILGMKANPQIMMPHLPKLGSFIQLCWEDAPVRDDDLVKALVHLIRDVAQVYQRQAADFLHSALVQNILRYATNSSDQELLEAGKELSQELVSHA